MKISTLKTNKPAKLALSAALCFSIASSQAQTTNNPAPYCASKFFANYNMFNNIRIKGTPLEFGPMGVWTSPSDYAYYNTFAFPSLRRGEAVPVVLTVYAVNNFEPTCFALWIDFNRNNSFEATELVMQNSNTIMANLPVMGAAVTPISKHITIPATASLGRTRARLTRGSNTNNMAGPYDPNFSLAACNDPNTGNYFGNTYDFNVEIINATTGINDANMSEVQGKVFPNPANDQITLQLEGITGKGIVTLADLMGRTVKQAVLSQGKATLSLKDLADGIYSISARTDDKVFREKVVVAH